MSLKTRKAAKNTNNTIDSSQIETTLDQGSHFINGTRRSHRLHTISDSIINQKMPSLGQALLSKTKPLPPAPAPDLATGTPDSATLSPSNTTALAEKTNGNEAVGTQSSEGAHCSSMNQKLWIRVLLRNPETDMFVSFTSQQKSQIQET